MKRKEEMSREEKLALLSRIVEGEDYLTDYLPVLKEFLDDEDAEVRRLAISGLWDYPDPAMIDPLLEKAASDPSPKVRCQAIIALGRYIYEGEMADYDFDWGALEEIMREGELPEEDFLRVKDFLLAVYRDEGKSLDERRFAVEALGFLGDPEVCAIIEEAYAHPDLKMKVSAIFAMGRSADLRWKSTILRELTHPDPEMRYEAARASGALEIEEAIPQLRNLVYDSDREIQEVAIWALGQIGGAEARRILEERYEEADDFLCEVIEDALGELALRSGDVEFLLYSLDMDEWADEDEWPYINGEQ